MSEHAGGNTSHTRFDGGRKVVAVEKKDGTVEVRYDQGGRLEGKKYKDMKSFEQDHRDTRGNK